MDKTAKTFREAVKKLFFRNNSKTGGPPPSGTLRNKNTIKAGGSTVRAQNVGLDGVDGVEWSGYPLDCYDY